jgi:hypothetical protein
VQESAAQLGVYLLNSINPYRLEGQKTIVLEMLQQLEWNAPDFIVLPAGNLGNTSAFGKALREAFALRLIDRLPRLIAVQAAGAAPFAKSFSEHFQKRYRVKAETLATAIKIGDPASHNRAVQAILENDDWCWPQRTKRFLQRKLRSMRRALVASRPAPRALPAFVSWCGRASSKERSRGCGADGTRAQGSWHSCAHHQETEPPPAGANRPIEIDADVRAAVAGCHQHFIAGQLMFASARRVLVTGATRPLGVELVRQCLDRGDRVIAAARNPAKTSVLADLRAKVRWS